MSRVAYIFVKNTEKESYVYTESLFYKLEYLSISFLTSKYRDKYIIVACGDIDNFINNIYFSKEPNSNIYGISYTQLPKDIKLYLDIFN